MSTLTSSPSPAASPRASFHPRYTPTLSSQRPSKSPRLSAYSSPGARIHAPGISSKQPIDNPSPRLGRTANTPASKPQTADAATQYTPEGLPPTAANIAGNNKRKGASPPPSMNPSSALNNPPPEPDVRLAPTQSEATATLPERPASEQNDAPHSPSVSKRPRTSLENVKIMPLAYETCNPKDLGFLISNMLMELIRLNDQIPLSGRLTRFHSRAPPGISCHDYLQRLIQHATLSPPILLSMVYYIDRLCALYPAFTISSLTVHRFLITATTVAAKGLSDSFWTNPTYARIGGISTSELATLEMEFLHKVQWRIVPKPEVLVDYYASLVGRSEGFELEVRAEEEVDGVGVRDGEGEAMGEGVGDMETDPP